MKIIFYILLGIILSLCGISITTEPIKFLAIFFNVLLIEISNNSDYWKA